MGAVKKLLTDQMVDDSIMAMGEAEARDLLKPMEPFDIEKVTKWQCPDGTGIPLITMPNVPRPLHGQGMQPRTIFGKTTWDFMRKSAYYSAGYKCEICGCEPKKGDLHCLEAGTEVLTSKGFKPIEEMSKLDTVAQYEPSTKGISFVKPTSTVTTCVNKKINIGYDRRFSVGYSDKHRILVEHTTNYNNPGYEKRIEYKDVFPEELHFSGDNRIPTAGFAPHGRGLTVDERIYIALNADGTWQYESDSLNYHVIRVKKERKQKRIKKLLSESTLRYAELTEKARPEYISFSIWTKPNCKDFWGTFSLEEFTQEMAKEFIDELCKWDGWEGKRKNGAGKEYDGRCWYTTSKRQADFVQAVAALAGITTTVSVTMRAHRDWSASFDGRTPSEDCRPQINIEFISRDSRGTTTMRRTVVETEEQMYCITVPSTYFVARSKDGYVFITGNCHELFSYDYDKQTGKFERVVAICRTCHDGIHSGRLITMFKNKNPLYPKSYVLRVVENCFSLVHKYNLKHKDEPLRVYATYLEYVDVPELRDEMLSLIKKYDIKFYEEDVPRRKLWKGWKVIVGSNTYESPYKSQGEWQEAMKKANEKDNIRNIQNPFSGGVFDEIDKIIDNDTQA